TAHTLITRLVNTKRASRIVTRRWTSGPTTQTPITIADTAARRWVTLTAPAPIFKRRFTWPAARARRLKKLWAGWKPSPETQSSRVCIALVNDCGKNPVRYAGIENRGRDILFDRKNHVPYRLQR